MILTTLCATVKLVSWKDKRLSNQQGGLPSTFFVAIVDTKKQQRILRLHRPPLVLDTVTPVC